jgi:DNA mismatch repair protein MutS2
LDTSVTESSPLPSGRPEEIQTEEPARYPPSSPAGGLFGAGEDSTVLGGFSQTLTLLEFDQIQSQLAALTRTVIGQEAARNLTPSRDPLQIATRQQETSEARQYLEKDGSLEFGPSADLREYVQRAKLGGVLRGEELHATQELLRAAHYDHAALNRQEELPLLSGIAANIPDLRVLEQSIGSAISPAGEILDSASPTLRQLRQNTRAAYNQLNETMQRSLRRLQRQALVQEPIITQRNGRLVLLIKAEMKSQAHGIVHDVSDSGATVFIEPMAAIEPGNRWREYRLAEEREEERVLQELSTLVGQVGEDLQLALDLVARLDLAMAKGRYSIDRRATPPTVSPGTGESRILRLTAARHPLLSQRVVPISLELGGDRRIVLITGPNAGGKTVALKTVGLLALMAHAGLHVPAEEADFPLFDGICGDIGDQQSILQSLSTFSSHIANLLSIMERATPRSLVLVDELGTSTDPEEGSALASAILRHFRRQGVFLVGTTHHRGVAREVQEHPGMINASVDLDPSTLEPTYHVTLGLPGRSYALTIAARLGLPQEIIEDARSGISPVAQATENLLRELQQERRIVESLREEAESARLEGTRLQRELESRLESVEATKAELVEEARQQLQLRTSGLLDRLQRMERAMDAEGSRSPAAPARLPEGGRAIPERRGELREVQRELGSTSWQPIEVKRVPWRERLKSGDRVFVRGISQPVEIISPPDAQERVEVLLGTMRAKIPAYQLERQAEGHPAAARQGVYLERAERAPVRRAPHEMDLRGLRVDEALARVDTALNDTVLDGATALRIIHGKGTGALRRAIREYLADHPLVATATNGEGPGGDGVTVVEIR